jgi:hypothetical protein
MTPNELLRRIRRLGVIGMFDVYVRGKSQLLVIRRGAPLPAKCRRLAKKATGAQC